MDGAILHIHPRITATELMTGLMTILPPDSREEKTIHAITTAEFTIRLFPNKKREEGEKSLAFPDGYFNFHSYLEFTPEDHISDEVAAARVSEIMEYLWKREIPCVVVSEWDDLLPHAGGYDNLALPWPETAS